MKGKTCTTVDAGSVFFTEGLEKLLWLQEIQWSFWNPRSDTNNKLSVLISPVPTGFFMYTLRGTDEHITKCTSEMYLFWI